MRIHDTTLEAFRAKVLETGAPVRVIRTTRPGYRVVGDQVQVRVEGRVSKLDAEASDAYFATRPRQSQIGAWASLQSQPLPDRATFEVRVEAVEARFAGGPVARPAHWGGYRLVPDMIEFWYGARYRLHERVRYECRNGP